ncbi:MAG: hypothetical protein RLY16_1968 [Bacteroidota bacterium]
MTIGQIIDKLEQFAPPALQESYDNAGLITGKKSGNCSGVLIALDATLAVLEDAHRQGCNLVVAHHPIVFSGLKRLNGANYIEDCIIFAIKHDIAIYAIHTNLDNVIAGVNGKIASILELQEIKILSPKPNQLCKLVSFVPTAFTDSVLNALFSAGAGTIGNYRECSYRHEGIGSFLPESSAQPFVGEKGKRHLEPEDRIEVVVPTPISQTVIAALKEAHPYEEVAFDLIPLQNQHPLIGSGIIGQLAEPISELIFLQQLKDKFGLSIIRHTRLLNKPIQKIAVCGGAGSFLTKTAMAAGADIFITGDMKYHEFFDANDRMIIADIGHFESEQYTIDLLFDILNENFPTFAVLKTRVNTNPVHYFGV